MKLLTLLLVLPIIAIAAERTVSYESILEQNQVRREALKESTRETSKEMKDLADKVRDLEATIKRQEEQLDPMDRNFVGIRIPKKGQAGDWGAIKDQLDATKAEKKKLEREISDLKKGRDELDKELERLDDSSKAVAQAQDNEREKATEKISKATEKMRKETEKLQRKLAERVEKLEEELKNAKVGKTIDELDNKLENIEDTIDRLEAVYDRSLMGSYMKRKMEKLMSSDSLCKGLNQCSAGTNSGEGVKLDDLFRSEPKSSGDISRKGVGTDQ